MQEERKEIIRFALNYSIEDIHTYSGYRGDLIVKITTKDKNAVIEIRKFALSLDIKEVVIKQNPGTVQYEIYCITEDESVYHLKTEEVLKHIHDSHPVDDWGDTNKH